MPTIDSTLIISGYGADSGEACLYSLNEAGCHSVKIAHLSELIDEKVKLNDFKFIILPGGSIDGDELGAAQLAAQRWKYSKLKNGKSLLEELQGFIKNKGLLLGIGNGFQLLLKLGILPWLNEGTKQTAALTTNASGKFENRWCHAVLDKKSPCIFTKGLSNVYFPVRHKEGRLVLEDDKIMSLLEKEHLIPLSYNKKNGDMTEEYPLNPSGTAKGITSICDSSGRIMGLMLHPEDYNHPTNHPAWTRGEKAELGISLFANAIRYLESRN